jgi:phosphoribosylformylglycinamidine synthase
MGPTAEVKKPAQSSVQRPPQAWRIEVHRLEGRDDPAGAAALAELQELGLGAIFDVRVGRGYLLPPSFTADEIAAIARELLADPVVDRARIAAPGEPLKAPAGRHRILVLKRLGVMDPVAHTVRRLLERTGRPLAADAEVATYRAFEIAGSPTAAELEHAATKALANETVEIVRIDREDLPFGVHLPEAPRGRAEVALTGAGDAELLELSRKGVLSLTVAEMRAVAEHFRQAGREPSLCELETIAQTWSEHCKHKTLTGIIDHAEPGRKAERIDNLLKSTIVKATHDLAKPWCISVFADNAGIVAFDRGWDVCIKVETHNHPSAIDPYGGAGTGIGGVIRDILGAGLGAKPIACTDCFFVGPPDLARDAVPKGTLHPRRILRGVVAGVRDYGNRMGIPTVNGGVWFDEAYVANPLVYAGTIGLLPRSAAFKQVRPGDRIVALGGRTGRDGIHGATFSSVELSEDSEQVSGSAVQIGDPITEKRVLDAMLRARDRGLYRGVTDCGAGGFSSAVGEMGEHTGADVDVSLAPLKYHGLAGHEIWISEAQERMVLSVPPDKVDELLALCADEDVEATVIGTFTDTQRLVVRDGDEVLCDLAMKFLHDGNPRPVRASVWEPPDLPEPGCPGLSGPGGLADVLRALLSAPNVASKEWIVRQYDHEVQGRSVAKPFVGVRADGPGDAAVLQPLAESTRGIAIACGANPAYGRLDPYRMAAAAIDEALRNAVAVGADPAFTAILDNFSWGNCDKPDRLGGLVRAAKACHDFALAFGTPFVSGKDSLNNEYRVGERTIAIPPTLLITALAQVPDVRRVVTMDAKRAGNRVFLVGRTRPELGGSHYLAHLGLAGGTVPCPDPVEGPALLRALHGAIRGGLVAACHDLSEGGLAVAASETAFAGDLGLELDLALVPMAHVDPADLVSGFDADCVRLFSESCTRFLVEVPPEHVTAFAHRFSSLPCAAIGTVTEAPVLRIAGVAGRELAAVAVDDLRAAFHGGFQG